MGGDSHGDDTHTTYTVSYDDIHATHAAVDHSESLEHNNSGGDVLITVVIFLFAGTILRFLINKYEFPMPYTVVLLVCSFAWGMVVSVSGISNKIGNGTILLGSIDPHLFLMTFIPPLIFESAFSVNYHTFIQCCGQALILAGPGVITSALLASGISMWLFSWNFAQSLLFGAMISATDPVAVVSLLREVGASKKLATLIEAESLLNDGSAFVLYVIVMQFVVGEEVTAGSMIKDFIQLSCGGILLGAVMGFLVSYALQNVHDDFLVETSYTVTGAFLTFWLGIVFEVSDILAVVAFGMYLSKNKVVISPHSEEALHHVWVWLSYVANTVVFILSGVIIAEKNCSTLGETGFGLTPADFGLNIALYILLHFVRAFVLACAYPVLKKMGYGFEIKDAVVLTMGALRGAIGLGLAMLTVLAFAHNDDKELQEVGEKMLFHTCGIVLWTLLINASLMPYIISYLDMDKITEESQVIFHQVVERLKKEEDTLLQSMKADQLYIATDWEVLKAALPKFTELKDNVFARKLVSSEKSSITNLRQIGKKFKLFHLVRETFGRTSAHKDVRTSIRKQYTENTLADHASKLKKNVFENSKARRATRARYSQDLAEYINMCDDVSLVDEIRHRYLASLKANYWKQFHDGMLNQETTKLLVESAEVAMDSKCLYAQWEYILPYTKVPKWIRWLYKTRIFGFKIPIVSFFAKRSISQRLRVGIQVVEAFVLGYSNVDGMLESFPEFSKLPMAKQILKQGINIEKTAKKVSLEIKIKYSDIYKAIKTYQAAMFLLNQETKTIHHFYETGVIEEKEFQKMCKFVNKHIHEASVIQSKVNIRRNRDLAFTVFKEVPWLAHIAEDPDLIRELFKRCHSKIIGEGEVLHRYHVELDEIYIVVSGVIYYKLGAEIFETREITQSVGLFSVLTEHFTHCDAVAATDVVVIGIPREVVTEMLLDQVTRFKMLQNTAEILLQRYFREAFKDLTNTQMNYRVESGQVIEFKTSKVLEVHVETLLLSGTANQVHSELTYNGEHIDNKSTKSELVYSPALLLPTPNPYQISENSVVVVLAPDYELAEVDDENKKPDKLIKQIGKQKTDRILPGLEEESDAASFSICQEEMSDDEFKSHCRLNGNESVLKKNSSIQTSDYSKKKKKIGFADVHEEISPKSRCSTIISNKDKKSKKSKQYSSMSRHKSLVDKAMSRKTLRMIQPVLVTKLRRESQIKKNSLIFKGSVIQSEVQFHRNERSYIQRGNDKELNNTEHNRAITVDDSTSSCLTDDFVPCERSTKIPTSYKDDIAAFDIDKFRSHIVKEKMSIESPLKFDGPFSKEK